MVKWPNDLHFSTVLGAVSLRENPFCQLPERVTEQDVLDPSAMATNLRRTFHCPAASQGSNLVVVWALSNPYTHLGGLKYSSTIVYVEKTNGSVMGRWPNRYLKFLASDSGSEGLMELDLPELAAQDHNYTFYSTAVKRFGPLSIWVASAEQLDSASGLSLLKSREWESRLLRKYREVHGCLPLKNRRT